ncbi:MAG TPA: (2Fe-2S)-binding protein, partial [Pantoea agglomerans]|nr:(2Fe-2S)-binding protein [Pantoea agglomerans]
YMSGNQSRCGEDANKVDGINQAAEEMAKESA